jgi:tRNA (mo5U34)-methyltransferase
VNSTWVFDAPHYDRYNESRKRWLDRVLQSISIGAELHTALDAGCGTGVFAAYLSTRGLETTGFDARPDTVAEARRRHSSARFVVGNVEDERIREIGEFDCVLCFGLLYHLENPFLAIRNLHALARKILIIESMITPGRSPVATVMTETSGEDQGLRHVALVPSEASLIKMLYHAGFANVYMATRQPDHDDFQDNVLHRRRRTMLVASRTQLDCQVLQLTPEPELHRPDIWRRGIASLLRVGN